MRRLSLPVIAVLLVAGVLGVAAFIAVVYAGLAGAQDSTDNLAPTVIYVHFWVGMVLLSVVFGDIFRALNPWRATARFISWVASHLSRSEPPAALEYPAWLGRWPAALSILAFISLPITTFSAIAFGAISGLTWLSTVPPTSALVALMFGTRWLATLFGFAFFSHQVGGFLGVWLGGIMFERFGSYDMVWWLAIFFGVLSAVINLPIVEKPVARLAPQAA